MKFINVIVLSVVAVLVAACCHKSAKPKDIEYIPPSAYDYSWFQYPEGMRIFKNQFNEFDTLIAYSSDTVWNAEFHNYDNAKIYNSCETLEKQEFLLGSVIRIGQTTGLPLISIGTDGHELLHTPKVLFQIKLSDSYTPVEKLLPSKDTTMTINGVGYADVNVIDSIQHEAILSEEFTRLYYSKSIGVIKYIKPDNTVWELTN